MSKPPKALLFDLGGVLLRFQPEAAFTVWAEAAGVDAASLATRWAVDDAYEALEVGAIDFPAYTGRLASRLGIDLPLPDWLRGWNAPIGEPFATVTKLLPALARQFPLYCFSNTNAAHQAVWQPQMAHLLQPLTKVYASWQLGARKPNADAYRKVVADMGFAPSDVLFIDDNRANVAGARAVGIDARAIALGHNMSSRNSKTPPEEPRSAFRTADPAPRGQDQPAKAPSIGHSRGQKSQMRSPWDRRPPHHQRDSHGAHPARIRQR